jgi:hypothetical protein
MSPQTASNLARLTPTQIVTLAIYGTVLWFAAAMLVRTLGPVGAFDGGWGLLTYVLVIPGTIPFILIARPIARLRHNQTATGIVIVTATALLLDGIAHAWFPAIYGTNPALIVKGAAAIFWGAGVGLVLSLIMNKEN